ncbi:helix-turn-helix DNA binding domain protein [Gordonia phage Octobien14]|uniref:Helix-turn-helix DNA binding domain protein n=1 Tax=Gordonia phage Octobien14 TaxID=2483673 RepID=A0A3G3M9L9_9CAUD|nr:helix-turn-helix DNA binding domain protein [Gordonia phage Octobien14]AYR03192.1 helix-turn-helix DNA binding domain protein [Gordonia phage Octobien14]
MFGNPNRVLAPPNDPAVVSSTVSSTTAARTAGTKAQNPSYAMALDYKQINNLMQVAEIPSITRLAKTSGVSRTVLTEFMDGKPGVSAKTVGALAGALGTYPDRIARWMRAA